MINCWVFLIWRNNFLGKANSKCNNLNWDHAWLVTKIQSDQRGWSRGREGVLVETGKVPRDPTCRTCKVLPFERNGKPLSSFELRNDII